MPIHHAISTMLRYFASYGRLGRLASQHQQCIMCASSTVTSSHCNLYFHRCSPEFSPFRPSSDSSSSSSHNAQNSHHEDKPKGTRKPLSGRIVNDSTHCDLILCFCLIFIGGAPNRPLPPTPDEEESGDRTLVMKRVSNSLSKFAMQAEIYICRTLLFRSDIFHFGIT